MKPNWSAMALAAALLPLLPGCGNEPIVDPGMASLPASFEGPGVYTVPAVPEASFTVSQVKIEQESGGVSIYYELPADLVGQIQKVKLQGDPDGTDTIRLSGTAGTSTCTVTPAALVCDEKLTGVHVDAADVAAAKALLPPGDPRVAAVEAFMVDPIGGLHVVLPAEGSP